jgi:hypothetical protein
MNGHKVQELDMIGTRCHSMQYQNGRRAAVVPFCGIAAHELLTDMVEKQITDFLDGKTNGENLLHWLYDYVLDEPIPARLEAVLKT